MSALTPALKLTLLISLGLHLATFIQIGGTASGYHARTVNSRFNVSLTPSAPPTPERETETKTETQTTQPPATPPEQPAPAEHPAPEIRREPAARPSSKAVNPARFDLAGAVTDSGAEQPKQVAGNTNRGQFAEQSYREKLLRHLEQHKHYPFIARRRGLEGAARIRIRVTGNGELQAISCLSGPSLFCDATVESARQAVPLPAPARAPYQLDYVMEYQLHQ